MTLPIDLAGWTPIHVEPRCGATAVTWSRLGAVRFTDPFFEQTIGQALQNPASLLFQRRTSLEVLETLANEVSSIRPRGFIFHLSRCGSTLVAQMLAALPRALVISEAPPIDQILTVGRNQRASDAQRISWLRGLIAGLTQKRSSTEQSSFIKFDSWHILELPLIRAAFPEVPWIFLYRDPIEVMVSQSKLRGTQMIPGIVDARIYGLDPTSAFRLPLDHYGAQVLARISSAGLAYAKAYGGRLINFRQLPGAVREILGNHFGMSFTDEELAQLDRASLANAKNPVLPYEEDNGSKQRQASPALRQLTEEKLDPIYRELEAWRAVQERSSAASAEREGPALTSGQGAGALGVRDQQFA